MSESQPHQGTAEDFHSQSSGRVSGQSSLAPNAEPTINGTTGDDTDSGSVISRTQSVVSLKLSLFPHGLPNLTTIHTTDSSRIRKSFRCSLTTRGPPRLTLLSLPSEMLFQIADHLTGYNSIKTLILTSKSLASLFLPLLYQRGLKEYTPGKLLYFAIIRKQNQMLSRLLYTYSVEPNTPLHGRTPLVVAVQEHELSAVKIICTAKADVNFIPVQEENSPPAKLVREPQGTALQEACAEKAPFDERHLSIVKVLLDHGADLSVRNCEGKTPLHQAVSNDNLPLVRMLLSHGADPNERVSKHAYGRINGAPSSQNPMQRTEYTPLHLAVSIPNQTSETREIIQLLVSAGANLEAALCSLPSPPPSVPMFDSFDFVATPCDNSSSPPANTLDNIASEPIYLTSTPLVIISLKLLQFWITRQTTAAVQPIPPKQFLLKAREENKRSNKRRHNRNASSIAAEDTSIKQYKGYISTIELLLSLGAELEPASKAIWPNVIAFPNIISGPLSMRDWQKWILLCSTQANVDLEKASIGARSPMGVKQFKRGWWYLRNYDYGETKEKIFRWK